MRWTLVFLFACGSSTTPATQPAPVEPTATEPATEAETSPPAPPTCLEVGEPTELEGFWPRAVGRIDGTTWGTLARTTGSGTWTTEVIALDGSGRGLVRADLGVQLVGPTMRAFVDGRGVRVVWMPTLAPGRHDPVRTARVDVTDPDRPVVSDHADLPGVPEGWVERAAGDGEHFILSMSEANADRTAGRRLVLLFEGTRKVREWEAQAAAVFCQGACGFVAFDERTATLTASDRRESQDLDGVCAAVPFRGPNGSAVVLLSPSGYAGWRIGTDGALARIEPEAWDAPRVCDVHPAHDSWVAGDRWLRWSDAGLSVEPVGTDEAHRALYAATGDSLAAVNVDVASHMQHSPTDAQGRRRYYRRWELSGARARLLPGDATADIPITTAEGMGTEPELAVFARGGLASLLALHSPTAPGQLFPIARTCTD
ncbi:MAG: hypothetical protein JJ863_00850 [Deltaproteobacteria bacterium]|nr:hypothetical protein [Deltaproteobacteria bacterium]